MTSPIETQGLAFVMVLVRDPARARRLYEGAFALRAGAFESEFFVEYELPDGNAFALAHDPSGAWTPCGGALFAVADLDGSVGRPA